MADKNRIKTSHILVTVSRGPGKRQRQILEQLEKFAGSRIWILASELAVPVTSYPRRRHPERSDRNSTNRALRTLERDGFIESAHAQLKSQKHRVVRLCRDDGFPDQVPQDVDHSLYHQLAMAVRVFNAESQSIGSRTRLEVNWETQSQEPYKVIDPTTGQQYSGVYISKTRDKPDDRLRQTAVELIDKYLAKNQRSLDDLLLVLMKLRTNGQYPSSAIKPEQ